MLVQLQDLAYSGAEESSVNICVDVGPADRAFTVTLSTIPDTASAGQLNLVFKALHPPFFVLFIDLDYDSVSTNITFEPSPIGSTLCETVVLLLDTVIEPLEVFSVEISSTDISVVFQNQQATVAIQDESTVDIEFSNNIYSVQETDGSIEVCAELSGGILQRSISVNFTTRDSTASGTFT